MKKTLFLAAGLLTLLALSCSPKMAGNSQVMSQAPGNTWQWGTNLQQALKESKKTNLPVVVAFLAPTWCPYCKSVDRHVLSQQEFANGMKGVAIGVQYDYADRSIPFSSIPAANQYNITGLPTFVVLNWKGQEIGRVGYLDNPTPQKYLNYFKQFCPLKK